MTSSTCIFFPAVLCVIILISSSQQMPLQSRSRRSDCSPNPQRDVILGLLAMTTAFVSEMNNVNTDNPTIEISEDSKFKTVADSLCWLMMYSDLLAVTPNVSTGLQALQNILQENIKDGCTILKNQSLHSKEVNFTTEELSSGSGDMSNETRCSEEDMATFRVYCVEQSLLQVVVEKPYKDILRAMPNDCFDEPGACSWIGRHFHEPERSMIVNSTTTLNCMSM